MALRLSQNKPESGNDFCFSYFVKKRGGEPSRVGLAKVVDISESGLCMEIPPFDSDLFVNNCGPDLGLNKEMELQIFCRSHTNNIFVEGSVKWFKQKQDLGSTSDKLHLCAGVIFSIHDYEQQRQISDLLRHLKYDTICCKECGVFVSTEAVFCYNCGFKLVRRRNIFPMFIHALLARKEEPKYN